MKVHRVDAPIKSVAPTEGFHFVRVIYDLDGQERGWEIRTQDAEKLAHAISMLLMKMAGEGVTVARDVTGFAGNLTIEGLTLSIQPAGPPISTLRFDKGQVERLRDIAEEALARWGQDTQTH
jgi:hypothetical protein